MTKQLQNKRTWANLFPNEKRDFIRYCKKLKKKEAQVVRELILERLSTSA